MSDTGAPARNALVGYFGDTPIVQSNVPCPFCPIPPDAHIVREWAVPNVVAFVPLNPVTPGHILIVPEVHADDIAQWPWLSAYVMRFAAEYVADLGGDCNVITSKGSAATQTVKHLHVHIVPRHEGDGLALPWTEQKAIS